VQTGPRAAVYARRCRELIGLNYMLGYDDVPAGKANLTKLAGLDFEVAVFGHGKPILSNASKKFARKFT